MRRLVTLTISALLALGCLGASHPAARADDQFSMHDMSSMAQMSQTTHMRMSPHRPATPDDRKRADVILAQLRAAVAKYQSVDAAVADGFRPFMPQVPQKISHFTSWKNAIANEFDFDAARPTSLMYERTGTGFKLVGAMYTASKRSTLDDLNARVPLSVGTWHEHINVCAGPPGSQRQGYFGPSARFGLAGSIDDEADCRAAGGTFKPVLFNWMLHVWPYETDASKVWATEQHPGAMH